MCNYGNIEDLSGDFYYNWFSSDTAIVTVDSYGNHTGVAVGSTSSYTSGSLVQNNPRTYCPLTKYYPSGGVNVINVQVTTVDLPTDRVIVSLQNSTGGTGTLVVTWNGPSGNAAIANTTEGPGTYTFNPPLGTLVTGQYTGVTAQWLGVTNTLNTSFDVLGSYLHTQYNTPAESQCSGASSGAYLTPGPSACAWNNVNLVQQFITQAWINGSGITNNYGACQEYLAGCSAPPGGNQNYFREVTSVTPGCSSPNNFLSSTSIAIDVFSSNHPLKCGDQVLIVGLGSGVGTVKTATDSCPACNGAAHVDDYSTSNACSLGTLGNFQTIRINR